jgi:hypothetical protein
VWQAVEALPQALPLDEPTFSAEHQSGSERLGRHSTPLSA